MPFDGPEMSGDPASATTEMTVLIQTGRRNLLCIRKSNVLIVIAFGFSTFADCPGDFNPRFRGDAENFFPVNKFTPQTRQILAKLGSRVPTFARTYLKLCKIRNHNSTEPRSLLSNSSQVCHLVSRVRLPSKGCLLFRLKSESNYCQVRLHQTT